MTTERSESRPAGRDSTLPLLTTLAIGVVLGVVALVVTGGSGLAGVVAGVVLTCASLGLGSLVLAWVTETSPAMSLVVALMTYTLQVVLLLAAYVVLSGSDSAREAVSGRWLGLTVIATTLTWLVLQVRALWRSRVPYFETGSRTPAGRPEEDAA